jgi:prevent-host-death family protein
MSALTLVRAGEYIGARQLRQRLAQVLKSEKPFFVTEHGKPVKVMLPYAKFLDLLEAVDELKDNFLIREVAQCRKEYSAGGFKPVTSLQKLLECVGNPVGHPKARRTHLRLSR